MTIISGPPKSDKEGVLVSTLDAARDSGYQKDSNILVFRHPKDSSHPEKIGNHDVNKVTDSIEDIYEKITPRTRNVIIAGAAHYDLEMAVLTDALVRSNRNVILTGPNLDVEGKPYGCMPDLMALADDVILTKAFCYKPDCDDTEATRGVMVDGEFEGVCAQHYYFPRSPSIEKRSAGSLTMLLGPMFSGKTRGWGNHIKKVDAKKIKKIIFKPLKANRYGQPEGEIFGQGDITLNSNERIPGAILIQTAEDMRTYLRQHPTVKHIFRDEIQFIPGIYDLTFDLLAEGYNLYDTGLPRGFNRKSFGEVSKLMCLSDVVEMNYSTCVPCGHPGTENQRMKRDGEKVFPAHKDDPMEAPGGSDSGKEPYYYEARCLAQWVLRGEPENKFRLERYMP
ncbi:MAG: hypothetical protein Q7K45_06910 [Nanoarchaeota archaeon]|nr:hypothetical protein [Nanoarchaeota archaeon]